jgi:hypothetical protein
MRTSYDDEQLSSVAGSVCTIDLFVDELAPGKLGIVCQAEELGRNLLQTTRPLPQSCRAPERIEEARTGLTNCMKKRCQNLELSMM